jgi:DNA primase
LKGIYKMFNDNDIKNAKEQLPALLAGFGNSSKAGFYFCPFCLSGTKKHKSPAVKINHSEQGELWAHCFSCGKNFDAIKIYQYINSCDFRTAVETLAGRPKPAKVFTPAKPSPQEQAQARNQNRQYLAKCFNCLHRSEHGEQGRAYIASRGISTTAAKAIGFGYDAKLKAITIPFCSCSGYAKRFISNSIKRYENSGKVDFSINVKALENEGFVYVTEGAFDAASIITLSRQAVALNSAAFAGSFCNHITTLKKENRLKAKIILALDADKAGKDAEKEIIKTLELLKVPYGILSFDLAKDANEELLAGRDALLAKLEWAENSIK